MKNKVILLADQPFQLRLMTRIAKKLLNNNIFPQIVLTDLFTFIYAQDVIDLAESEIGSKIFSMEMEYISWQNIKKVQLNKEQDYLEKWATNTLTNRNLKTLFGTDPYTNGFEHERWFKKVPDKIKIKRFADTIKWCESIVKNNKPELIVSIGNSQFITNVFYEISNRDKIPFMTFENARVGARWLMRKDFHYGMTQELYTEIMTSVFDKEIQMLSMEFLDNFKSKSEKKGLYESSSYTLVREERKNAQRGNRNLNKIRVISIWCIYAIRTLLLGRKTRKFQTKYFDQNFLKIVLWEFNRVLAPFSRVNQKRTLSNVKQNERYLLWCLHMRPEGSALILGDGIDELDKLLDIAGKIPDDLLIYVKENPLMIGLRDRKFLRRLKSHPKISLIDPYSDTKYWIENSMAVIGMAGTVLLEAQVLGIPSWSFGHPEFELIIDGQGEQGFTKFVQNLLNGDHKISEKNIFFYVNYIFSKSSPKDHMLNAMSDVELMNSDVERMAQFIKRELS